MKNTGTGQTYSTLQPAIDAAKRGARLIVMGTCVGSFRIESDLTIVGRQTVRSGRSILDGAGKRRVLWVRPAARVMLRGLVIQNGRVPRRCGGGVLNRGTMTLHNVVVRRNRASLDGGGGGICNRGTLRLTGATRVKGNVSYGSSGVLNHGRLVMDNISSVTGNRGYCCAGVGNFGTMIMNGASRVSDNHGNGVALFTTSRLTMNDRSSISGNTARTHTGGVAVTSATLTMNDRSSIRDNRVTDDNCWYAAGVLVDQGEPFTATVTMTGSSVIRDNHAPCSVGGIRNGLVVNGEVVFEKGTLAGVRCAPQSDANVYGNTPTECQSD